MADVVGVIITGVGDTISYILFPYPLIRVSIRLLIGRLGQMLSSVCLVAPS